MPVTSVHLFSGARKSVMDQLKAFGMLRGGMHSLPGLLFIRAMGCGRGLAFSLRPDWQRYLVMMECSDEGAEESVAAHPLFRKLADASREHCRWGLKPIRKHGLWDGEDPFSIEPDSGHDGRIAVLTRASIALLQIPAFIRHSYATTDALRNAPGLRFSIGMGEYPLIRQATFSIWENDEAMKAYAYGDALHRKAMKAKLQSGMFREELFARFRIMEELRVKN